MIEFKPFFINSNICLQNSDINSFENFMKSIAGNTGNSYITYALIKELMGDLSEIRHIQNIYEYNFDKPDLEIDYINNEATHVFLILQDQIRLAESYGLKLPYEKIMNFISKINKPVIIAGLGANSFEGFDPDFHKKLDPNLITFLKFLSDHCIEIGIRGHFTEEILHNIGINNTRVIGCPSFFEMGKNRHIKKHPTSNLKSIILTSKLPIIPATTKVIMQDFLEEDIIKQIAFNYIPNNIQPWQIEDFNKQKYHIFSSIQDWKQFISPFNFAIGYRLHGSILAINSGVPALCLNGDSRATEMCQFLNIPHNPNLKIKSENDYLKIYEELDVSKLNDNYPILYNNFVDFIHKNNLLMFEENSINYEYIKQPSLQIYGKDFYTTFYNRIYLNSIHENLTTKLNNLSIENKELKETLQSLNDKNINLCKKTNRLLEKQEELNQRLNKPTIKQFFATCLSPSRVPTPWLRCLIRHSQKSAHVPYREFLFGQFLQQIFSVKNENRHKTIRILGIKFKFRRKSHEFKK